jgi:predicted DNA-binding transcriptional regulator AlpA
MTTATVPAAPAALPRLISAAEVSTALGLSRANFYAHVDRGNFPFKPIRIGKSLRFSETAVLAFINGGAQS